MRLPRFFLNFGSIVMAVAITEATLLKGVSGRPSASEENHEALKGKVMIITGATNGLGLENARCLLKYGCHVVFAIRNREKLGPIPGRLCLMASQGPSQTPFFYFLHCIGLNHESPKGGSAFRILLTPRIGLS